MNERLTYIKHVMDVQKRSAAVVLRRADVNWAVGEIERLRAENERIDKRMKMYEKRAVNLASENDLLKVERTCMDSVLYEVVTDNSVKIIHALVKEKAKRVSK